MRLAPRVIPAISRETIQQLMQDGDIEVEPMRVADAEMDLSAIMREYLTNEERVNQATREALERRGYDQSRFDQVRREMADARGFKMGDEGVAHVVNQMIEFLLLSRNVEEVFAGDDVLRPKVLAVMKKYLDLEERPPPGHSGGMPTEARVSDAPPRPQPPEDPDRREPHATDGSDVH